MEGEDEECENCQKNFKNDSKVNENQEETLEADTNQENLFESLATTRQAQMNFNSKLSPSSAQLSFVKLSPY